MEEYYFIYANMENSLNLATSIRFIAEHKKCRAIYKENLDNANTFDTVAELLYNYNTGNKEAKEILMQFETAYIM